MSNLSDEEKKRVRIDAIMEGESVVVRNIGDKKEVSEMELVALCNFAELGLSVYFERTLNDETDIALAIKEREKLIEAIEKQFAKKNVGGFQRLAHCTVAILRSERFVMYICEVE